MTGTPADGLTSISDQLPPNVVYDVTRMVRQRRAPFATGIDKIDAFILKTLLDDARHAVRFVVALDGRAVEIPTALGMDLAASLHRRWFHGEEADDRLPLHLERAGYAARVAGIFHNREGQERIGGSPVSRLWRRVHQPVRDTLRSGSRELTKFQGKRRRKRFDDIAFHPAGETAYFAASHQGIADQPDGLALLRKSGVTRIASYIHDIIPLDYPEYMTPRSVDRFRSHLDQVMQHADVVFVSSRLTAKAMQTRNPTADIRLAYPTELAAPAAHYLATPARAALPAPYFVTVGTIEPRKNHSLLLNVWRRLVIDYGDAAPVLHIVGKRGWLNAAVFEMLDRCDALKPHVVEHNTLADADLRAMVEGATAMLLPSFVEGFCLPALEARRLGVPVFSSGFPCDELGIGDNDRTIDPLDGISWYEAIRKAFDAASAQRAAKPIP